MHSLLFAEPAPSPTPTSPDPVTWADALEAWSTLSAAIVALAAAIFTLWLLIHQIGETRRAREDAAKARAEGAEERELARKDREFAAAERRDQEAAQARAVVIDDFNAAPRTTNEGTELRIQIGIWNYSSEPVLNLVVLLWDDAGGPWRLWRTGLLEPGGRREVDERFQVTPGTNWLVDTTPEVYFTDANGRSWSRHIGSAPHRDAPPTPFWTYPKARELENEQ